MHALATVSVSKHDPWSTTLFTHSVQHTAEHHTFKHQRFMEGALVPIGFLFGWRATQRTSHLSTNKVIIFCHLGSASV
jgi:hypothetical protein